MAEPRACVIEGRKFMWDGKDYDDLVAAQEAERGYQERSFETRIVQQGDKVHVYTRRVVAEVPVEGSPPV